MATRIIHHIQIALTGVLAALVVVEVAYMLPSEDAGRNGSAQAAADDVARLIPSGIDSNIAAILQRPLFSSSRAAHEEEDAAEPDDVPAQLSHRLTGVAINRQQREALFQNDGEKPMAVGLGDKVEGWTVLAIEQDHVALKGRSGEQIVELTSSARSQRRPRPPTRVAARPAPAQPSAQNGPARPAVRQAAK
jgi:hypothetical protein